VGTRAIRLCVALLFALAACGGAAPAPVSTVGTNTEITAGTEPIGATEVATVVSITDGDTIRVDRGHGSEPVRYIGIDAPEPKDPGGSEATARNAALVKVGSEVILERDVSDVDQFDRLLRYVWLHRGSTWTLVNMQLISDGVARAVAYPPDVQYQAILAGAQAVAKSHNLGVWGLVGGPAATPQATKKPSGGGSNCHSSYRPCLPIVGDLDCPDVRAMGLAPVRVIGPDDYRLDRDNDGIGCE
jgi:micrococcal nuclease